MLAGTLREDLFIRSAIDDGLASFGVPGQTRVSRKPIDGTRTGP